MKLGMEVGLGPDHIVLDGDLDPKKGAPSFRPMSCGKTAGWIKMPLGMEVGLGPGDIVRWEPTFPQKREHRPQFAAHSIVAKRLDGSRCHLVWR